MRRSLLVAATAVASLAAAAFAPMVTATTAADAVASDLSYEAPGVGGFSSSNIEYVATLLSDSPGVGARVHTMPSGERRFYVSSVQGLRIYNIDDPALPILIGAFEIANWENEDVSVSKDGKTVLMSEFTGTGYTYVFQVSDPVGPLGTVTIELGSALPLSAAHIVDCVDDACDYFYGSEGQIWDATDKFNVTEVAEGWGVQIREQLGGTYNFGSGHNIDITGDYDLDGDGDLERVVTADTTPIVMMDATDPLHPVVIATSDSGQHTQAKTAYQHNNKIRGFEQFVPRDPSDPADALVLAKRQPQGGGLPITAPTNLRRGELLLGNGETNFTGTCGSGSGPLTSWSVANWDTGAPMQVIETFRPVSGTYDGEDSNGGNAAVNALGCSGHWFDVRDDDTNPDDIIVAAGWYEHGTRVIRVDGETGSFEQLGFFQPVVGSTSAAHWVVDEESGIYIYTVDYMRGVDIMKYDPEAPVDSPEVLEASWFMADEAATTFSEQKRYLCRLGALNDTGLSEATAGAALVADMRRA